MNILGGPLHNINAYIYICISKVFAPHFFIKKKIQCPHNMYFAYVTLTKLLHVCKRKRKIIKRIKKRRMQSGKANALHTHAHDVAIGYHIISLFIYIL